MGSETGPRCLPAAAGARRPERSAASAPPPPRTAPAQRATALQEDSEAEGPEPSRLAVAAVSEPRSSRRDHWQQRQRLCSQDLQRFRSRRGSLLTGGPRGPWIPVGLKGAFGSKVRGRWCWSESGQTPPLAGTAPKRSRQKGMDVGREARGGQAPGKSSPQAGDAQDRAEACPPSPPPRPTQGLITSRCFLGKSGTYVPGPTQTCSLGSTGLLPCSWASLLPEWVPRSQPECKACLFMLTCE